MNLLLALGVFAAVAVASRWPGGLTGEPGVGSLLLLVSGPLAAVGLAGVAARAAVARIDHDRDGRSSLRAVRFAASVCSGARLACVLSGGAAIVLLGPLGWVRGVIGDLPLVDEAVLLVPLLAGLWLIEVAWHPVEARLHEARVFGLVERGRVPRAASEARARATQRLREDVLLILSPLLAIYGASEVVEWIGRLLPGWLWSPAIAAVAGLAAVVVVLTLSPLLLRRVLPTTPMTAGVLRDSLEGVWRGHGVRVSKVLVWLTDGGTANALVMGPLPRLRYVVFTDALLERLPSDELEAVAAHEVAHLRLGHQVWMLGAVLGAVGTAGGGAALAMSPVIERWPGLAGIAELASGGVTIAAAVAVLGLVSRTFERQADAFAAKHLSGFRRGGAAVPIDETAAATSARALASVARINGMNPERPTYRHGSINGRRRRLLAIAGRMSDDLPQDRAALAARAWTVVLVAIAIVVALVGRVLGLT